MILEASMNNPRTRECTVTVKSTCRELMVLMIRQFTSSYTDSLPVTVLVSLEAEINCTVCCVVVSHPSCIVFALCDVLSGLQKDVCNHACSLNTSSEFGHTVGRAVFFCA